MKHEDIDHTGITGISSGAVATDSIWDAAGDLALGTGSNTAARLAIGAAGLLLKSNGTTATWASPTFSGCRAYHNTTQTVAAAVTALSLNSEDFDTDGYHDNTTNNSRLTVPTTGYYRVTGHVQCGVNGLSLIGLRVNGSTMVRGTAVSGVSNASSKHVTTQIMALTAGDYVELWAYQGSSESTGDTTNGENMNSLSIEFLGA